MNININQLKALKFFISSTANDIELENISGNLRVRVEYPDDVVDNFLLDKLGAPIKEQEEE